MVRIKSFKAVRPAKEYAYKVASLPYDTMSTQEAREIYKKNPFTYLRIDRAEIELKEDVDPYSEEVYKKSNENLEKFINEGIFIEDKEGVYIYREILKDIVQVGIVACVSVDDSVGGKIKKHERVKPDKVEDRTNHIRFCNGNTGTVLLTYKNNPVIDVITAKVMNEENLYDFYSDDAIRHTVWKVDKDDEARLINAFMEVENLYIADGHHRVSAAENFAEEMKRKNKNIDGDEEYNYFLAMISPKDNLYVMDYNRVVKTLNGYSKSEFLDLVGEKFLLEKSEIGVKPEKKYDFGMYIDGDWYKLVYKHKEEKMDILESLDVNVLQKNIIEEILGIYEPQKDERIDFIGGIRGIEEIEKRVDEIEVNNEIGVGFSLYPTDIEELIKVADMGEIMPAKSTWFEPKVRCGLFVHRF